MKTAVLSVRYRAIFSLAVAGAVLLQAAGASAQSASPYYSFAVANNTSSFGDSIFPVYDSLTFNGLAINEAFADGFSQTITFNSLETGDFVQSSAQIFSLANGAVSDPIHGALTSALLTGTLAFPGIPSDGTGTLDLTLQPTSDPASQYAQTVYTPFSASLLGSASTGVGVGVFSLLDSTNTSVESVIIDASPVPAAVPEASTTISFGLLLVLGLGSLAAARRRTARL